MTDIVLLNSGGIDSRVTAAMLADIGWTIHSLLIDWNPNASAALQRAAAETADRYCASHTVLPWGLDWRTEFPKLGKLAIPYTALTATVLGAQYAHLKGVDWVATGARSDMAPDREWVDLLQDILDLNVPTGPKVLLTPVFDMDDFEVRDKARELGVDLTTTVSCPEDPPCGTCKSCRRRARVGL